MPENNTLLPIGELARQAGTAPSALRYYERIGLLPPGERAGGKRHYPPASADRLALLRLCQDAGFTLEQIRQLLAEGTHRGPIWTELVDQKIAELGVRISEAQRAKSLLEHARECPHRDFADCPNFRAAVEARSRPGEQPRSG